MPKVGMEPIRRQQLIDATIASIAVRGFADTTVKRISAEAGVSTGIVHHYFGGKDDLLFATMRNLLQGLGDNTAAKLRRATTPEGRVEAVITANFDPEFYDPNSVVAWLVFWAQVPHSKEMRRLQRINAGRLLSNLRHALKQIFDDKDAKDIALGLAILLDGIWVRSAMEDGKLSPETCRDVALDYFRIQLAVKQRRTIN